MRFFGQVPSPSKERPAPPRINKQKKRKALARRFVSVDGERALLVFEDDEAEQVPPPPPPPPSCSFKTEAPCSSSPTTGATNAVAAVSALALCPPRNDNNANINPFSSLMACGTAAGYDGAYSTDERMYKDNEPAMATAIDTRTSQQDPQSYQQQQQQQRTSQCLSYSRLLSTALLLDDEDESLVPVQDEPQRFIIATADTDDSIDFDLQNRINKSDTDLMDSHDGADSPGALRLTKEGLQRHERKTFWKDAFQDTMNRQQSNMGLTLAAFRLEKARRQRQKEKDEAMLLQAQQETSPACPMSPEQSKRPQQETHENDKKNDKRSLFRRAFSNKSHSEKTLSHSLTSATTTATNSSSDGDLDKRELERIAQLRQRELERQRKREKAAAAAVQRRRENSNVRCSKIDKADETGLADESGIEVLQDDDALRLLQRSSINTIRSKKRNSSKRSSRLLTTVATTKTSSHSPTSKQDAVREADAVCVVCHLHQPTHIAVPCLHYSFCAACADKLKANQWSCPVCGTPHTTYNQVFA